jgi:hypothetical protein
VRSIILALSVITVSCSGPSPEGAKPASTTSSNSHPAPKDISGKFPLTGQVKMELVPDHLLGKEFMPGGNLGEYKTAAGDYQIFLLSAADARAAAFILLDWKGVMPEAKYLAHMGGYFGMDQGRPIYVFAKGPYLVGFIGLAEAKADAEARRFAARL